MRLELIHGDKILSEADWKKRLSTAALTAAIGTAGALGVKNAFKSPQASERPIRNVQKQEDPAEEPEDPIEEPTRRGFNYDDFRTRLEQFEGTPRNRAYRIGNRGEIDIAVGHAMYNPNNTNPTAVSRRIFQDLFGNDVDFDEVLAGRVELTDDQVEDLVDNDVDEHLNRARRAIDGFDEYPDAVQFAIVDGVYRGDLGPATIGLINNGNWGRVADENLNHRGYRTANTRGLSGIRTRMNANAAAYRAYAEEVE